MRYSSDAEASICLVHTGLPKPVIKEEFSSKVEGEVVNADSNHMQLISPHMSSLVTPDSCISCCRDCVLNSSKLERK